MIAVEARWFMRVGKLVRLFISVGLHEPSSSDRKHQYYNASGRTAVVCFHMLNAAPRSLALLHHQSLLMSKGVLSLYSLAYSKWVTVTPR